MKLERAFIFPHAITVMSVTSTKFGISSKELIGSYIIFLWRHLPHDITQWQQRIIEYSLSRDAY